MATLILENLPPGKSAVLCDNLRLVEQNGKKIPIAVKSVIVPSNGIVQITGIPDSNYSLIFSHVKEARHSLFSIDVGDCSKFPGISQIPSTGPISDNDVREGARRALIALNEYGLVQRNVPVTMIAANVPGINSSGLLVPNQVQGSGSAPETLFHTGNKPIIADIDGLQQKLDECVTDIELDKTIQLKIDEFLAGKDEIIEDLSGQLNGKILTYLLSKPFKKITVFLNGLLQLEGAGNDYIIASTPPNQAITFSRPLKAYNSLIARYTTA